MACSHIPDHLFETENGVVLRCDQCGWFNVLFGPVVLANDRDGFKELRDLIVSLEPQEGAAHHASDRRYQLHTANRQIGLAFTEAEVEELRDLLNGAAAMDELDGLLDDALSSSGDTL